MKKRVISILLTIAVAAGVLSGCGGSSSSNGGETGQGEQAGTQEGAQEEASVSEDSYTVVMGYIGDAYADEEKIEAAVNDIIGPELNASIDLRQFSFGTYQQELQLILSGDEDMDIVPIIIGNAAGYVNNGQVIDLTDLLDQYGTNIKNYVDQDFLACPQIGETLYGITTMREQITNEGILMRRDILEELGYQVDEDGICPDITSLADLTKVYEEVYAKYPNMYMCASTSTGTPLFRWEVVDFLTDGFGVLADYGQSTEVVNLYETDEFKEFATLMYEWNQAGYFSSDAATTTETNFSQMKTGNTFSYFAPYKAGAIEQDELTTGQDLAFAKVYGEPYVTSYSINFFCWGIARNSKNPEKAFQVLDYIYGSPEVMNIINWGIEGEHYQVLDEENKEISYAEGLNADNTGWCLNMGWELPNQEIAYVWEGETSAKWDVQRELIASATRSKALGFTYDSSLVSTQLTALNNAKTQYYDAIGCGSVDPETTIALFNEALYNAGLQDVMDSKQEQLNEWLSKQ